MKVFPGVEAQVHLVISPYLAGEGLGEGGRGLLLCVGLGHVTIRARCAGPGLYGQDLCFVFFVYFFGL